jgi:DNA-binding XRE family transcriptional regulator
VRKIIKIPRILKINWVKDMHISVVYNNGENRIIDFKKMLNSINVDENSPAYILFTPDELAKVKLENNTLSWDNVEQYITMKNNERIKVPFEIGADVLLEFSVPDTEESELKVGKLIRSNRLKMGLTQHELALRSGTTRNYISRIENENSDIELTTLRRIIEIGLGKNMVIDIK